MKKIRRSIWLLILCVGLCSASAMAANASAKLTGPGTVRVGDTITLSFKLNGKNLSGVSGSLSYDTAQLTLVGTKQTIGTPWEVEFNGNNFVAYDNKLTNPINGEAELFTVTFKVKSLGVGAVINVSCVNVIASDGQADEVIGNVTYSATVAPPLSTDSSLKSLSAGNATISPAFNPNTTAYTAEVPFEVSKLDIQAVANDGKAKVSVDHPALTPNGVTEVKITVRAENGATRTYTITVKRAQDPNYVPSDNNDLAGISVSGFLLSPAFSPERTSYVIWLPYETETVTVSGVATDKKASVQVIGGTELVAGADNEIKVVCVAENGEEKTYTIVAKRAAAHGEEKETENSTEISTEAKTEESTEAATEKATEDAAEESTQLGTEDATKAPTEEATEEREPEESAAVNDTGTDNGKSAVKMLFIAVGCLIVGCGTGIVIECKVLSKATRER